MKYLKYTLGAVIIAGLFTACKKENLGYYSGRDNIYFTSNYASSVDTGLVSFGYAAPGVKDSVIKIPVSVMGGVSSVDRAYKVSVADGSTAKAGTHYDALPDTFKIRAGRQTDTLRLKLHRTADMLTTTVSVVLQLQPNDNFKTDMQTRITNANTGAYFSYVTCRVMVNDILTQPKYWLATYSGTFSRKKIILMSQVLGASIESISLNSGIPQQIYWARTMQLYLNDQKANGNIIYEDDGTVMAMGPSVQ